MGAALDQGDETDLRIGAGAPGGGGATELGLDGRVLGDIQGAAVDADDAPLAIPGPRSLWRGNGMDDLIVKALEGLPTEAGAGLGDGRLPGDMQLVRGALQPAEAFHEAAQDLPAGGLGEQSQGDDVIDHHMGRQVAMALACASGFPEHGFHPLGREKPGHHPESDEI